MTRLSGLAAIRLRRPPRFRPADKPVIYSNIEGTPGQYWGDHTIYLKPLTTWKWLVACTGASAADRLAVIADGLRLFLHRRHFDGLVTYGAGAGEVFSFLQSIFPWNRKRHVMIDCLWYLPWNRVKLRAFQYASRAVHVYVVWASHEVDDYSRAFGIPKDKFIYVPFHHTIAGHDFRVGDDGYLFAGGNYDRDYRLLIDAVRPLGIPVKIITTLPRQLAGVDIPPHVEVYGVKPGQFRQVMASAHVTVVPMAPGLLHSGGQQTCLNSMVMGKPTIAVGRKWASDLIEDGENGLIVDYGDVEGLRKAIQWVMENPEAAGEMSRRGKALADSLTTQRCMERIFDLATTAAIPAGGGKIRGRNVGPSDSGRGR